MARTVLQRRDESTTKTKMRQEGRRMARSGKQRRRQQAVLAEADVLRQLRDGGLTLAVTHITGPSGRPSPHWRVLDETGERSRVVVHYWPATNCWWCPLNGAKGLLHGPDQLPELAKTLGCFTVGD